MIANDTIKTLSNKFQTTELNIRREYFQHLFLSYFYQQSQTEEIYFKGGTALRLFYNSPRFSEDLDFSSSLKNVHVIEQVILDALLAIEREGVKTNITEAKTTSGGYLFKAKFQTNAHLISIQLEISLRQGKDKGEVITVVSEFIPVYTVVGLIQSQLIKEKIKALLSRKKPRDFYDIYFFLRANLLSAQEKAGLLQILPILKSSQFNFEKELKEFLPKNHWSIIRNFPHALEQEIKRFIKI